MIEMQGIVKWFDKKKGYGFIYGTGNVELNSKENVLPEYFVHINQVIGGEIKEDDMVQFEPHMSKRGMVAKSVSVVEYKTENDPRAYIAQRICEKFDLEIPCISWMGILYEDMKELYNYLRAVRNNDTEEVNRISAIYELEKVPKEKHVSCIISGGYEIWKYDKEQMEKSMEDINM